MSKHGARAGRGQARNENRTMRGKRNAEHIPFRYNGGQINPPHMREVYRIAGLTKVERVDVSKASKGN